MKVYFKEVGRNHVSFVGECRNQLTLAWLEKQVKPYCMSSDLSFSYNEQTNLRLIFGGLELIGKFRISKE